MRHPDPTVDVIKRFRLAQDPFTLKKVYDELHRGEKRSHWIWFIFPQGPREGTSPTSQYYALTDQEAIAFLSDTLLAVRLAGHTRLVVDWMRRGRTPEEVLGEVDALKFRSSMELFARVAQYPEDRDLFKEALQLAGAPA